VVARPSRSGSEADEPEEHEKHEKPQDPHHPTLPDRDGLATLQSASLPCGNQQQQHQPAPTRSNQRQPANPTGTVWCRGLVEGSSKTQFRRLTAIQREPILRPMKTQTTAAEHATCQRANSDSLSVNAVLSNACRYAAGLVAGVCLLGSVVSAHGAFITTYSPDQTGTLSGPVEGLAATSTHYLLTNLGGSAKLDKNFDGNNQESGIFVNPSHAQDAASLNDSYMFQLGIDNGVRKVDLSTGNLVALNGTAGINAGPGSFGIGYDPVSHSIGIGNFNGSTMSFSRYDLDTGTLTSLASFGFDTATYGTPSGLDFVNKNGNLRMLVGTRDQFSMETGNYSNFILDMNALTGSVDQYATTPGSTSKLRDLFYHDGRLATGFQSGGSGNIRVGDFNVIPEPSTLLLLGAGALVVGMYRRRK
jgi:hypothetical protein